MVKPVSVIALLVAALLAGCVWIAPSHPIARGCVVKEGLGSVVVDLEGLESGSVATGVGVEDAEAFRRRPPTDFGCSIWD